MTYRVIRHTLHRRSGKWRRKVIGRGLSGQLAGVVAEAEQGRIFHRMVALRRGGSRFLIYRSHSVVTYAVNVLWNEPGRSHQDVKAIVSFSIEAEKVTK